MKSQHRESQARRDFVPAYLTSIPHTELMRTCRRHLHVVWAPLAAGFGDRDARAGGPFPSYHVRRSPFMRPAVLSVPSISSSQPISGLFPSHSGHDRKSLPPAPAVVADSSTAAAEPLASAIASALTQLGLIPSANATSGASNTATTSDTPYASLTTRQNATQPIQQYRSMASSFSNLAQALSANTSSTASGGSSLPTVFQSLWTSLGASSVDASSGAMPSLPSFLNTLARNLSESGVSGLRGVFVDTVA